MNDTEEQARHLFAAAARDIPPNVDLLRGVRARTTAHKARTRAAVSAATAGVLAAGVLFTATVTRTPSALAQVAAAAARTAGQSYQIRATMSAKFQGAADKVKHMPSGPVTIAGNFDPARGIGQETQWQNGRLFLMSRYLGRAEYLRFAGATTGKPWLKLPEVPQARRLVAWELISVSGPEPVTQLNPQDLLASLKSASHVTKLGSASGPGWTGTRYAFTSTNTFGPGKAASIHASGTVAVDSQGRVRTLAVTVTTRLPHNSEATKLTATARLAFSGFGTRVTVTPPPADEVSTPHIDRVAPGKVGTKRKLVRRARLTPAGS